MTHIHERKTAQQTIAGLRTPYHSLTEDHTMVVPTWATQRSVYRAGGRTMYLVDTDHLDAARADLARLDRAGWNVQVAAQPDGDQARIALTRKPLAHAA